MAEGCKLSLLLVDPDLGVADPQALGQTKGVALVIFRPMTLPYGNYDGLLHVGS